MEFLISAIDVNTCVDIIHIAEVFGMPQLEDKATKFMLDRFPDFMKSSQDRIFIKFLDTIFGKNG